MSNPSAFPPLDHATVKTQLENATTVRAALTKLKTSATRLRAYCVKDDELRALYRKLSDRGRATRRNGMTRMLIGSGSR